MSDRSAGEDSGRKWTKAAMRSNTQPQISRRMGTRVNPWLSLSSPPPFLDDDDGLLASGIGAAVGAVATAGDVVGLDEGAQVGVEVGTEAAGEAVGDTDDPIGATVTEAGLIGAAVLGRPVDR